MKENQPNIFAERFAKVVEARKLAESNNAELVNKNEVQTERDANLEYAAGVMKKLTSTDVPSAEFFDGFDNETKQRMCLLFSINKQAVELSKNFKNPEEISKNRSNLNESQIESLFNDDFKLVISKILNDLCEFHTDQNGRESLRYRENIKDTKTGERSIDSKVIDKVGRTESYKDELAQLLALENGRETPNYIDKMNACGACDFLYVMGDSSLWDDKVEMLPYVGLVSAPMRALNIEGKAIKQFGNKEVTVSDSYDSCRLSGGVASYIENIEYVEKVLNKPVDGLKKLNEKFSEWSGDFFCYKILYGLLDFCEGKDGTLAESLMNYAFDKNKQLKPKNQRNFDFDFIDINMDDYYKTFETAVEIYKCINGQLTNVDKVQQINKIKESVRKVENVCDSEGNKFFSYPISPFFWRDVLVSVFGYDRGRISSDYICLDQSGFIRSNYDDKEQESYDGNNVSYNLFVAGLLRNLSLSSVSYDRYINENELLKILGVDIERGEMADGFRVTLRNDSFDRKERNKTYKLKQSVLRKNK